MTFAELKTEIDTLRAANDWEGIVQLITPDNVQLAVFCIMKGISDVTQPLTRPGELLELYKLLLANVAAAPSTDATLAYFLPENILLAGVGAEYEAAVDLAETVFTNEGFLDPAGDAVTKVTADWDALIISQNATIPDICL